MTRETLDLRRFRIRYLQVDIATLQEECYNLRKRIGSYKERIRLADLFDYVALSGHTLLSWAAAEGTGTKLHATQSYCSPFKKAKSGPYRHYSPCRRHRGRAACARSCGGVGQRVRGAAGQCHQDAVVHEEAQAALWTGPTHRGGAQGPELGPQGSAAGVGEAHEAGPQGEEVALGGGLLQRQLRGATQCLTCPVATRIPAYT
jgi:hypothetical protein